MRTGNSKLWIVAIVAILMVGSTAIVDAKVKKVKTKNTVTNKGNKGAKKASVTKSNNLTFTVNGVKFEMVPVEGGSFTMYDPLEGRNNNVTLKSYYIGQTEVTQALWKAVMGDNQSTFVGDNLPVQNVSWYDCDNFVDKLNKLTGKKFRLPDYTEWVIAAKGGKKSKGYKYAGGNDLDKVAWYPGNSGDKPHPVATKAANELGIYDMMGNVHEWCSNYDDGTRSTSSAVGPGRVPPTAVYCGTSWFIDVDVIEFVDRRDSYGKLPGIGLRLALDK